MNIIEREIEKRQEVIDAKVAKTLEVEKLKEKIVELEAEIAEIDVTVLEAEIEELKTFLPKEEEHIDEEPVVEVETADE